MAQAPAAVGKIQPKQVNRPARAVDLYSVQLFDAVQIHARTACKTAWLRDVDKLEDFYRDPDERVIVIKSSGHQVEVPYENVKVMQSHGDRE